MNRRFTTTEERLHRQVIQIRSDAYKAVLRVLRSQPLAVSVRQMRAACAQAWAIEKELPYDN